MFFELRQYKVLPGQMERWQQFFEEEVLPFQLAKGMVILGSFRGEDDPESWVWIRRFESEAERERLYKDVYESDHWKEEVGPQVPAMLDRSAMKVTRLVATPHSVIQ